MQRNLATADWSKLHHDLWPLIAEYLPEKKDVLNLASVSKKINTRLKKSQIYQDALNTNQKFKLQSQFKNRLRFFNNADVVLCATYNPGRADRIKDLIKQIKIAVIQNQFNLRDTIEAMTLLYLKPNKLQAKNPLLQNLKNEVINIVTCNSKYCIKDTASYFQKTILELKKIELDRTPVSKQAIEYFSKQLELMKYWNKNYSAKAFGTAMGLFVGSIMINSLLTILPPILWAIPFIAVMPYLLQ